MHSASYGLSKLWTQQAMDSLPGAFKLSGQLDSTTCTARPHRVRVAALGATVEIVAELVALAAQRRCVRGCHSLPVGVSDWLGGCQIGLYVTFVTVVTVVLTCRIACQVTALTAMVSSASPRRAANSSSISCSAASQGAHVSLSKTTNM
jgi:hypothetical protein